MQKVIKITYFLMSFFCCATVQAQGAPGNPLPGNPSQELPLPTQKATDKVQTAPSQKNVPSSSALPVPSNPAPSSMPTPATPQPIKPDQNMQPSQTANPPADKKAWMENMQKGLPGLLCQEDHYFVQCFEVNYQQCTEFANIFVESCLNNANLILPQMLDDRQRQYWGQMIGRCSYDLYEKFMAPKKKSKPECTAPKADANAPQSSGTTPQLMPQSSGTTPP